MDTRITRDGRSRAFIGRPTIMDVGIGVLYFFTSHMVIRAMYYIGLGRSSLELTVFFLAVIASAITAHLLSGPFQRFRLFIESALGIPAVSVVAGLGVTLALISMLPRVDALLFYLSGVLLGLACGWIVVIWTSTININRPDHNSFFIQPSLTVAVLVYFLFRCVSSFSETITQGFLLALPLVTIVCIIQGYRRSSDESMAELAESAQALQVLVVVAAIFALGCSVAVSISGRDGTPLSSGLSYMVLFEVLALALMAFCCWILYRFSRQKASASPRVTALLVFCIIVPPLFLIGLVMGGAGIPVDSPKALWESNVWVLIIAIFAYDIRESLYAIKGLAVGLMFEAMCMGQMLAYVATLDLIPYSPAVAACLAALYFAGICRQLLREAHPRAKGLEGRAEKAASSPNFDTSAQSVGMSSPQPAETSSTRSPGTLSVQSGRGNPTLLTGGGSPLSGDGDDENVENVENVGDLEDVETPSELLVYCRQLALIHGLTPREEEILGLIAMGRSAKYIAEELTVSQNTTRTHVKHIYEKLNIHSKQELLDLVLFGSGLIG